MFRLKLRVNKTKNRINQVPLKEKPKKKGPKLEPCSTRDATTNMAL